MSFIILYSLGTYLEFGNEFFKCDSRLELLYAINKKGNRIDSIAFSLKYRWLLLVVILKCL